ncbi:glycosyltransferase family 2 protein [Clostridium perfringens]|uniref:glycosyltransferase family 2 protein n=1 Tax=Clostridium perfringens TaxID=1502 RepID=UPI002148C494|nr:glycosyltransferase family 2 protein [Clostridium perfringens]MDM0818957.1 glycosyltransferase family 2 protein [Clostridium perfringens]UUR81532.1 glycosyltransferase family 2 protein [Clostridium perfringens]
MKVCAVVVTFNRLELLKLCIEKLLNQSKKLDEIMIINNASTDGTKNYLESLNIQNLTVINLEKNVGGAGGFNEGIKLAYKKEYDYIWIMDDDTIATKCALNNLINKINELKSESIGFVCSNVLYKDETACVMNVPKVKNIWNTYASDGAIEVESASFVSILVDIKAIKAIGLPIKEFFIWGDDIEFTKRVTSKFKGYMVTNSIVYHYMNSNKGVDIVEENGERINRYFYQFRNRLYTHKKRGIKFIIKYLIFVIKTIIKILFRSKGYKLKKISIVLKGALSGIFFNPKIEFVE